jgi:hypothetical protein
MLFGGTFAGPEQLAVMEEALEAYCLAHNIKSEGDKEYIAHLIILMFEGGAKTVEEMTAGLERVRAA